MLLDSDEELDKIFDDSLRISKVMKPKKVLGDKTNKQNDNCSTKENKIGGLLDTGKLHFSYNTKKVCSEKNDDEYDKANNTLFLESNTLKKDSTRIKKDGSHDILPKLKESNMNQPLTNIPNNIPPKEDVPQNIQLKENVPDIIPPTTNIPDINQPVCNTEGILTSINQELQDLILNKKLSPKKQGLLGKDKLSGVHKSISPEKKISTSATSQFYLREIEHEFMKIRESHRKMLMTRNRVLRMVEKEIDFVKREAEKRREKEVKLKNDELKLKDNELKLKDEQIKQKDDGLKQKDDELKLKNDEIATLKVKIQVLTGNASPPNLMDNYENLELKYSEQVKEIEGLRLDNYKLKIQIEELTEKYTKLRSHCKENVLRYKDNLDKLYLESLRNMKKKHVH